MNHVNSSTDSVATPSYILDSLRAEFGDLYDPCPFNPKFDAKIHKDGLTTEWGNVSYCNPPFSKTGQFVKKAFEEWSKAKTCIVLIKSTVTASKYFKDYVIGNAEIRFIHGKVTFPGYKTSAWFPLILLVFRKNKKSNTYTSVSFKN